MPGHWTFATARANFFIIPSGFFLIKKTNWRSWSNLNNLNNSRNIQLEPWGLKASRREAKK
jgi:hypothetical protein